MTTYIAESPFDTVPTRRLYRRRAVSAAVRVQSGRFIAAPFDADGWQTEPSIDVGPTSRWLGDIEDQLRRMFGVSEIVLPR